jgi:hypothetical protein
VHTIVVDFADSGEVFNALSMHFDFEDLKTGGAPAPLDTVVYFAAIPRILIRPDNAMFAANVLSIYASSKQQRSWGFARSLLPPA